VREYENDSQIIRVNSINDPFVNDPSQPSPGRTVSRGSWITRVLQACQG
jgi:hypothetical protein